MYNTSFTISDIGKPPQVPRTVGQRSLHGSQSHANLHYGGMGDSQMGLSGSQSFGLGGTSGGGGGLGISSSQGPGQGGLGVSGSPGQAQQYMPGYLLAASQGQVICNGK